MQTGKWVVCVVMGFCMAGGVFAQGNLSPPHGPAPTMRTLEQIYQVLTNVLTELETTRLQVADLQARMQADRTFPSQAGMVLIPAGSFVMGAATNIGHEASYGATPQHSVYVSGFYMDQFEIQSQLWTSVYTWATNNGYVFANQSQGKDTNHPAYLMSWPDALAWCNARSAWCGITPCYTNADGSYYTNSAMLFEGGCDWEADGFRLPTEAEWEKAARGGIADHRFPWEDAQTIQHMRANYSAVLSGLSYDTSVTSGYHPATALPEPRTLPAGYFAPNAYGLYDMAGNVNELCWDWFSETYYAGSPTENPRGPDTGSTLKVIRGGSWNQNAVFARCAYRSYTLINGRDNTIGFRCVRRE
ncbi:MAG: formylglycine-generating enzyme family protein [Spartobacteria bacterium]|nr:formylglycine-generating enzyme family protein [Spartobacteria bacterium]